MTTHGKPEYLTSEAERRYRKKYYQEHREVCLERMRKYREQNREKIAAYNKHYSMTHDRSEYDRKRWEARKNESQKA